MLGSLYLGGHGNGRVGVDVCAAVYEENGERVWAGEGGVAEREERASPSAGVQKIREKRLA